MARWPDPKIIKKIALCKLAACLQVRPYQLNIQNDIAFMVIYMLTKLSEAC